jgi:hypothetical protein
VTASRIWPWRLQLQHRLGPVGNGSGTFAAKSDYGTGGHPISVASGDVNGDGYPDLAVANTSSNSISLLLGNGNGTFGTETEYATGNGPYSVVIGDLSGDGKPDIATANNGSSTVSVLLNQRTVTGAPILVSPSDGSTVSGSRSSSGGIAVAAGYGVVAPPTPSYRARSRRFSSLLESPRFNTRGHRSPLASDTTGRFVLWFRDYGHPMRRHDDSFGPQERRVSRHRPLRRRLILPT